MYFIAKRLSDTPGNFQYIYLKICKGELVFIFLAYVKRSFPSKIYHLNKSYWKIIFKQTFVPNITAQ